MTSLPALINRQFNSPIKLYSAENVADTLSKQTQVLSNGAVGIDFHHLAAPGNLANSAVLKMLEEESQKEGKENNLLEHSKPRRRVQRFDWPPKGPDRQDVDNNENDQNNNVNDVNKTNNNGSKMNFYSFLNRRQSNSSSAYNIRTSPGLKRIAWPPLPDTQVNNVANHSPVYAQEPVNNYPQSPNSIQEQQQQNNWSPATQNKPLSPQPQQYQKPIYQPPQQQQQQPIYQPPQHPIYQQAEFPYQQPTQLSTNQEPVYQQQPTSSYQEQPSYQGQQQEPPTFQRIVQTAAPAFEPPPSYIHLRSEAPVRQASAPVFESQPAATRGFGPKMRGDQKWPPAEQKAQAQAENAARQALAKGPAVRPRAVKKDYSQFFAQNALTTTYPGYRAPPGTQHYVEEGTSNF